LSKPNRQQVARAGEHFVAAELHRRGAYAVTFAGNMPEIDILASDVSQSRTVAIQVKTKRSGAWQTALREWTSRVPEVAETRFWVFVDLHESEATPDYFIVPEKWMQDDIQRAHGEYLERHGGHRARTPTSKHHAIRPSRVAEWRDRWDLLGLL
jgi:hypothetical protein